jgi:hypothetical protein
VQLRNVRHGQAAGQNSKRTATRTKDMSVAEPTMIGLSESTHAKLKRFKEDGHFREMVDAYRFGIGLALAQGMIDPPEISSTTTVFSVATIDPDQTLFDQLKPPTVG